MKYFGLAKFHHRSLSKDLRIIQVFSAFAFVAMCFFVFQLNQSALFLIIGLATITFLYAIPFLPNRFLFDEQQNLREISGLKVYVIALVWMAVTVILPLLNNAIEFQADSYIMMIQRFLYVLVLMLPFEIRDLNYDSLKLATIPQKIGVKNTKVIGALLLMVFLMLEFFKDELSGNSILVMLLITFITLLFLVSSKKMQTKYYTAFWVESLPVWWFVLVVLLG